jgi:hypothetical protein
VGWVHEVASSNLVAPIILRNEPFGETSKGFLISETRVAAS